MGLMDSFRYGGYSASLLDWGFIVVVCFAFQIVDNACSAFVCRPGCFLACSCNLLIAFSLHLLLFSLFHP